MHCSSPSSPDASILQPPLPPPADLIFVIFSPQIQFVIFVTNMGFTFSCWPTNEGQSHSIQLRLPEADTNFKSTFDRYLTGCSIPNLLQDCKRRQAHSHRHAVSIKLPALNQSFRLVDEHNRKGSGQVSLKPSQGVHAKAKWTKFHRSFIKIVFFLSQRGKCESHPFLHSHPF